MIGRTNTGGSGGAFDLDPEALEENWTFVVFRPNGSKVITTDPWGQNPYVFEPGSPYIIVAYRAATGEPFAVVDGELVKGWEPIYKNSAPCGIMGNFEEEDKLYGNVIVMIGIALHENLSSANGYNQGVGFIAKL